MTEPMPVLELRQVCKSYPGTPPVEAVRGVTLTVRAGELAAVVGPSGSGKTTLLHLMAALDRPTQGSVRVAGRRSGSCPTGSFPACERTGSAWRSSAFPA